MSDSSHTSRLSHSRVRRLHTCWARSVKMSRKWEMKTDRLTRLLDVRPSASRSLSLEIITLREATSSLPKSAPSLPPGQCCLPFSAYDGFIRQNFKKNLFYWGCPPFCLPEHLAQFYHPAFNQDGCWSASFQTHEPLCFCFLMMPSVASCRGNYFTLSKIAWGWRMKTESSIDAWPVACGSSAPLNPRCTPKPALSGGSTSSCVIIHVLLISQPLAELAVHIWSFLFPRCVPGKCLVFIFLFPFFVGVLCVCGALLLSLFYCYCYCLRKSLI